MLRVLICHNYYLQPGGEDQVFADEARLLADRGHAVRQLSLNNTAVAANGRLATAAGAVWSRRGHAMVRRAIRESHPDVVHVHNFFPLISPAVYYAAHAAGVPVVQTLHNYRLLCPNALFFRDGGVCEDCVGRLVPWPGVVHKCYRGSRGGSAAVATMLAVHRGLGTWARKVDAYIALTEFARRKFVAGGLPEGKIWVKPNFLLDDPGAGDGAGGYVMFVGRLDPEKGVRTLLAAWRSLGGPLRLRIVGDGLLAGEVTAAAAADPRIEWLGSRPRAEVGELMRHAACLVFPSECYETFGRVVIEAFAAGTPVAASTAGSAAELVEPGVTGEHFRPGDPADLARAVTAIVRNPARLAEMRTAARAEFEARYTAGANYETLVSIYDDVLAARR